MGGLHAHHTVPHSSSLRSNRRCDDSRLWRCAVDAEHPVTSIGFDGGSALHSPKRQALSALSPDTRGVPQLGSFVVKKRPLKLSHL